MKQLNKKKSFTLIELLIVISIIGILMAVSFPYYQSARQQLALQRAASKLVQDIRMIQEMAMSTKEIDGGIPSGGYGVYLRKVPVSQTSHYVLFADKNNNHKYDSGSGAGETIEQIFFENKIKIKNLDGNHLNIIFMPPDPTTSLRDGDGNELVSSSISIEISLQDETKTKIIGVNKVGLITVE